MPYKCVNCSAIITDGSKELLTGCSCGGRFFFYIKEEKLKEILAHIDEEPVLSKSEKKQIEEDVREIAGVTNEETPVFLDFESVKILKPGKYVIDLQKLFAEDKPKIYKLEDGKYIIDLVPLTKSKKTTS